MRYGYRRLTVLLKREGWQVNAKRIYRLYIEEGLIVRTQKRRERAQRQRVPLGQAVRPNQKWSMDFVAQRLPDGRWIRVLTVVDQFTRECLTLFADNAALRPAVAGEFKLRPPRGQRIAKIQTGGHTITATVVNGDWHVRLDPHKEYTITFQ